MGAVETGDLALAQLPRWGRVVACSPAVPWLVVDPANSPVKPVETFLADFTARGHAANSVRSYAFDLLRWWRWLLVVDVRWDCATSAETRGLVLCLHATVKPRRNARTASATTAGQVNPITRKASLGDQYQARTIRHSNAVIRSFYEFWLDDAARPLVNPMPLDARRGRRAPVSLGERPVNGARIRYNPRLPKRLPRAMPDPQRAAVFSALRSNRDRAIVAMAVTCGARPSELLGNGVWMWTGVSSWSVSSGKEAGPSSGFQSGSSSGPRVILFIPVTRSVRVSATMMFSDAGDE